MPTTFATRLGYNPPLERKHHGCDVRLHYPLRIHRSRVSAKAPESQHFADASVDVRPPSRHAEGPENSDELMLSRS
jgi:hypothetical protein